jgi:ribose-phosphate pyrophosphokinase
MDLHAGQIQGFFDLPVDHLGALPLLVEYLEGKQLKDVVVVSPDVGGTTRARNLAEQLSEATFGILEKRRPRPNVAEVMTIIGEVRDRTAVLLDDMIDTGGTIAKGAEVLVRQGANTVYACATHAVFSGNALERLLEAPIQEIVVTNTIPVSIPAEAQNRVKVLSVAPLLAEAMLRIHEDLSVSKMFAPKEQ